MTVMNVTSSLPLLVLPRWITLLPYAPQCADFVPLLVSFSPSRQPRHLHTFTLFPFVQVKPLHGF